MKALLIVLLFSSSFVHAQCLDLDIMIVADYSGSVQGQEQSVVSAIEGFASGFSLDADGVNLGIVIFNNRAELAAALTGDVREILVQTSLLRAAEATGSTYLEKGLTLAATELLSNGRPGYRRLVIVISDGDVTLVDDTLLAAQQLQLLGIGICAVLIRNSNAKPELLRRISNGCYAESDYNNLADELKKLDLCL